MSEPKKPLAAFRIIGWSLTGSLMTWALMFFGLLFYFRMFEPSDAPDILAWQKLSAMMGSLGCALIGLVLGAIYGIVGDRSSGKVA